MTIPTATRTAPNTRGGGETDGEPSSATPNRAPATTETSSLRSNHVPLVRALVPESINAVAEPETQDANLTDRPHTFPDPGCVSERSVRHADDDGGHQSVTRGAISPKIGATLLVAAEISDYASERAASRPVNSNRVPPVSPSVTATSQPWALAISRTIVSPKPVPTSLVV